MSYMQKQSCVVVFVFCLCFYNSWSSTLIEENTESFSKKLWEKHKSQAIFSQYTPFIISLAAGNLPLETFEGYLYQDIHYLKAYAQAAYIAREYATDEEAMNALQKKGDSTIKYIVYIVSYFKELGLEYKADKFPKNEATMKYIDFLLYAARTKVTIHLFAAMTPCERLYAYLGWMVKDALSKEELEANKYKMWIKDNSDQDPEPSQNMRNLRSAKNMEYFIDKLSVGLPQHELDEVEKFYKKGLEHETEFNLAQQIHGENVVVPLWKNLKGLSFPLVSDFDLSCNKSHNDLKRLKDYERHISNQLQLFPPGDIKEAFEFTAIFEKLLFPLNVSFGQFKVESGCISLLLKVTQKEKIEAGAAYIISAYWSDESINTVLLQEDLAYNISHAGNNGLVESSIEKLEAFNNILQNYDNEDKKLSLYIGDSVGDFLCLLEADIGVVYGSNVELEKVAKHFSVSSIPLFKGLIQQQMEYKDHTSLLSWKSNSRVIYTFSYWAEMEAFILGFEGQITSFRKMFNIY